MGGAAAIDAEMSAALSSVRLAMQRIDGASTEVGAVLEKVRTGCTPPDPNNQRAVRRHERDAMAQRRRLADEAAAAAAGDPPPVAMAGIGAVWGSFEEGVGSLGLPDCPSGYEAASHIAWQATADAERRARDEAARVWMCAVQATLEALAPSLRTMRSQVEWCVHHWDRLEAQLQLPEPPPQVDAAGGPEAAQFTSYSSALYGDMATDDLRAV